ncbi:hypothetical protein [Aerolutibacter ruishenii]|uniref:Uncharacterized protein n=1 Tax=Aerolutibacter ruishenii TaxID=686800 RepID=A0A562M3A9_9GAMM|nr:hypothetical protein [Lysobacter ruishenii]TWI14425.1 hypothetical protein IP93_00422 [Lysobacter ruishenii]
MHSTRETRWERGMATLLALALNGWAVWALATAMQPTPAPEAAPAVLQVAWVRQREPGALVHAPAPPQRLASARPTQEHPPTHGTQPLPAPPPAKHSDPTLPTPVRPLSAVYVAQLRQAMHAEGNGIDFHDPLADRPAQVPGQAANRFRMRTPMSPARAVAMVGMLFGGSDPAEPCRSNRARIAGLGTAGNSERLQQELDFERRWCRP